MSDFDAARNHDSYQEWFCSECGHDAKAEILAALREAFDAGRREEAAEWEPMLSKALNAIRDDGETEGDWIGPLEDELDEFLRRRGGKR